MIDIAQFQTVGGLALVIGLIIEVAKRIYDLDSDRTPVLAIAIGIVGALVMAGVNGQLQGASDVLSYAIGGFIAALFAIGGYEVTLDKVRLPKADVE